mmetsp:Transcript_10046/g.32045  ORF Transcript_10046/g.32045 Transcript_10046/m.32045 type:complete len:324 (+) Transcript_10046:69-1040(+)
MLITIVLTSTFVIPPLTPPCLQCRRASDCSLRVDDVPDGATDAVTESRDSLKAALERDALKGRLLRVCAACNRGFGASALDRASVDSLLDRLCRVDPCEEPTAGVTGSDAAERWVGRGLESAGWSDGTVANGPLDGVWRLVYTNATDVLSLDVNPVAGVGPISQEISLPDRVVNVIEFYPRALSLLPAGALPTTTRVRVGTRARARSPSRVGLTFETVGVEARELLGIDVSRLLPQLSLPLPRLPGSNAAGADSDASPAFFDVRFLDGELLVILQNQPGGAFVLVRETQDELRLRTDPGLATAPPRREEEEEAVDEDYPGATG